MTSAERELIRLLCADNSWPRAGDYYLVEIAGYSEEQVAVMRDVSPHTVEQNVKRCKGSARTTNE